MKAAVFDRYGAPANLAVTNVPVPVPRSGEIRVRVRATTVTRTDTATLRAHPFFARAATGLLRPKMHVLGIDFAGEVDLVGDDVSNFSKGDRVFGLLPDWYGGHAQYVCVSSKGALAPIPEGLRFDQAVVGEGAWYASGSTDVLKPGQSCLIYGASGAIGTAAVQLAKAQGAEVTAVVGHRHVDLACALGADRVVDYQNEDFTKIADRYDLVFDAVGKTSWFACRKLLKSGGVFTATDLGPFWSNIALSAWHTLRNSHRVRIPFPTNAPAFVARLSDLMVRGQFRGVFDRSYPLDEIVTAFRYVEAGHKTGIVVIHVD